MEGTGCIKPSADYTAVRTRSGDSPAVAERKTCPHEIEEEPEGDTVFGCQEL